MIPFHWKFGPFAVSPVELTGVGGILLVAWLVRARLAALGAKKGDLLDLILAALVGGAVGARLFFFIPLWLRGLESGGNLLGRWAEGSGYFGGLAAGTALVCLVARLKKLPVLPSADAILARLPIGFALGKLGCFVAGCCYGRRCDGFPGVAFAPGSLAYSTQQKAGELAPGATSALPVHPTQLYELGLAGLLAAGLLALERRSSRPGEVSLAYFAGYSAWRFGVEFFRADPGRHGFGGSLSDSQWTALVVISASAVLWILLRRKGPDGRTTNVNGPSP
jgi:phosphatidylglycerol:prolipoprotein diacylglycerol transferase